MSAKKHAQLEPGEIFDSRYEIVGVLGQGNFATVYHARQTVHELRLRNVALKVFKTGSVSPANAREVFNDAITLLGLMDENPQPEVDQHLIHILDGGIAKDHGDQSYLAMELVRGKQLDRAVRRHSGLPGVGGIPVDLSLFYLRQILLPLGWMHSRDPAAVHGDLHFGNVLVAETGQVKLADFGLAARLPSAVFGGAIKCQAPETLLTKRGGTQSDVYAVGLMWYEMLTGRYPFTNDELETLSLELQSLSADVDALAAAGHERESQRKAAEHDRKQQQYVDATAQAKKHPPEPASDTNEQLRDYLGLEDILNRSLAYEQSKRTFDAGQMAKAIEDFLGGRPDAPPTAEPWTASDETPEPTEKLPEQTPQMLLDQAMRLAQRRQFDQAHQVADKLIGTCPSSPDGWLAKARIALAHLRWADSRGDAAPTPQGTCGGQIHAPTRGQPHRAADPRGIAILPPAGPSNRDCAARRAEQRQGLIEQAYKSVGKARQVAPDSPEALEALAEVYRADGQASLAKNLEGKAASLRTQRARRHKT